MIPADFTAPCGGSAVISGSDTNLDIQVYDADGNPYPTTIEDGSRQVAAAGKVHGNHTANSTVSLQSLLSSHVRITRVAAIFSEIS